MSIGEKLIKITENMPDVYGKGYAVGQSRGYELGYQQGQTDGGIAAREQCLLTHYAATFFGSGTNEVLEKIPFRPDIVAVYTTHPYTSCFPNCYRGFTVDFRSCGRHMGNFYYVLGEGITKSGWLTASLEGNNVSYENGTFRFGLDAQALENVVWMPNVRYHLIAVKFPEEDIKDLIREQIQLLPDEIPEGFSGQLSYTESVVYAYFTQEEWENLTARKPNWTFLLK